VRAEGELPGLELALQLAQPRLQAAALEGEAQVAHAQGEERLVVEWRPRGSERPRESHLAEAPWKQRMGPGARGQPPGAREVALRKP
jgi:hypothetical protein